MSSEISINDYHRKVKTREELRQIIGYPPREKSVIMCHGTFDLVHPGHVWHLMYAKGKADILVASLTSDAHIGKASYRPFVPQQLRAMNLAALEVVDFVVIDENPTPIESIEFLRPDYFAKGYEYSEQGVHPRTREEIEAWYGTGGNSVVVPRNGEAWDRAADGSVLILRVEDFMIEVTLDDASQCPSMPSMNNGVPIIYRIAGD